MATYPFPAGVALDPLEAIVALLCVKMVDLLAIVTKLLVVVGIRATLARHHLAPIAGYGEGGRRGLVGWGASLLGQSNALHDCRAEAVPTDLGIQIGEVRGTNWRGILGDCRDDGTL